MSVKTCPCCGQIVKPNKIKMACVRCGRNEVTDVPEDTAAILRKCETFICKTCRSENAEIEALSQQSRV